MCTALKELENEGREKGRIEGKIEGKIEGIVKTCRDFGISEQAAAEKLQSECGLSQADAMKYIAQYYPIPPVI